MSAESGLPKSMYRATIVYGGKSVVSRQTVYAVDEKDAKLQALANYARPLCYGSIYLDPNYVCYVRCIGINEMEFDEFAEDCSNESRRGFTLVILRRQQYMWHLHLFDGWKSKVSGPLYPLYCVYFDELTYFVDGQPSPILKAIVSRAGRALVVASDGTKHEGGLFRWQIEACCERGIPIVVANLNNKRELDIENCPTILVGKTVMHVGYDPRIIAKAVNDFCENYSQFENESDLFFSAADYEEVRIAGFLFPNERYPVRPDALPELYVEKLSYQSLSTLRIQGLSFRCFLDI